MNKSQKSSGEFNYQSGPQLTVLLKGKIVSLIETKDDHGDDFLDISFTDGSRFRLRYDWIYEWELAQ